MTRPRLAYKNRFVQSLQQSITGDCLGSPLVFPDMDTPQKIVFELSQRQFTQIVSCLMTGADIEYPEIAHQIYWDLVRNVECSVNICDEVANCIENSTAVQEALATQVGGAGGVGGSGGKYGGGIETKIPKNVDPSNIISGSDCTEANYYGIATSLVNFSFQTVKDVFEQLSFSTTAVDLYAEIADNIPVFSTLPWNYAIEFGIWGRDTAYAAFLSFETTAVKQKIACDLKCIMEDNGCAISYDDLAEYFINRSIVVAFDTSFEAIVQLLIGQTADNVIGYALLGVMYGMASIGAKFGGILNAGYIQSAVQDFLNDYNYDYPTQCDPCSAWEVLYSFAYENLNEFTLNIGAWQSQTGIGSVAYAGGRVVQIDRTYPATITGANEVIITVHRDNQGGDPQAGVIQLWLGAVKQHEFSTGALTYGGQSEFSFVPTLPFDRILINGNVPTPIGYIEIRAFEIKGNGGYEPT